MPIYEYECKSCGRIEEAIQKFSDKPITKCGHCSGTLHKIVSQSTFHLKGSGWYVTDYANKATSCNTTKTNATPKKPDRSCDKSNKPADTKKAT